MPDFTPAAAKFWRDLGPATRDAITTSVWCRNCRGAVEIVDFGGEEQPGGIVLQGTCKTCGGTVARFVEDDALAAASVPPTALPVGTDTLSWKPVFTDKQGQYLAFIHYYTKVNGQPPAEADFQRYFRVSPPSVHAMIVALEKRGFLSRVPGKGRSISLNLGREQLPDLE
jgi:hypothetical protein